MRALPILAAILCTAPFARAASSELDLLQSRCQEYERQIRQLEEENSRLKSLTATAAKTPAPVQAAEAKSAEVAKATAAPKDADDYGIVRNGDTLRKVAKRHGTTPEALAKLNNIKNPSLIRAGQKLILPEKSAPVQEAAAPRPAVAHSGTHKVKQGETFYSIARHYGLSANALQSANPGVKASGLKIGQTLRLGGKAAETPAPAAKVASSKSAPKTAAVSTKAADFKPVSKPAEAAPSKPAPMAEAKTESSSAPAAPASQAVSDAPRIRSIAIDKETEFAAFAAAHGTSTAKLNALNGLNLNSGTVLAKGSELYVPAQP